jgi:cytochrome P450
MHHLRRDAIQPYFSAASVARFQPQVETLVTKMCARLRAFKGKNQVVNIGDVFRCLATDVATAYTFRKPFGHLDHPDFEHDGNASVRNFSPLGLLNRQLRGWIFTLVKSIPSWLSRRMASPATSGVREFYSVSVTSCD